MKTTPRLLLVLGGTVLSLLHSSCSTTSLSNPGGRGHDADLSLYELTGDRAGAQVTEKDISAALGGRSGSLPPRGGRILLVQSGAHQPDQELTEAFRPLAKTAAWNGIAPDSDNSAPAWTAKNDKAEKPAPPPGSIGRRLRLVAAQQGCSHVVVVFGEIQSASETLPGGSLVGWLPIVGDALPTQHSGIRLFAQALVMETASPRYTIVTASPRQDSGLHSQENESTTRVRSSLKLKKLIYPELAAQCFRE